VGPESLRWKKLWKTLNAPITYATASGSMAMTFNEIRKDYLLNRWVVIATERGRRPTDLKKEKTHAKIGPCPMCPGNESMTPPAVLVYLKSTKGVRKTRDSCEERHRNWLVRCIPNLYPAFSPPEGRINKRKILKSSSLAMAVGHHEVLIESPNHDGHPADSRSSQLMLVVDAYIDRLRELAKRPYVNYVSIFRNHGLEAGASLSHAHSQIISTPMVPRIIREEIRSSKQFWDKTGNCIFCNICEKEYGGPRLVLENSKFIVFTPYASVYPIEFWIVPKKHEATPLRMSQDDRKVLATTMKTCFGALKTLVDDPPYNYGFHLAMNEDAHEYYHWHIEVYPKLATWAGFELSTGMYINTVTPESAAASLREIIST
jgi:UDPglucose--hexose-1-phosphate uridylyltransferase